MNRRQLLRIASGISLAKVASAQRSTGSKAAPVPLAQSLADEAQRTAWFRTAKFGMFIHWGPYSVASVEASWPIIQPGHWGITEAEYRALPGPFNPVPLDPDRFIDRARTAGQKYMVFTT